MRANKFLFTMKHRAIGVQYLLLGFAAVAIGTLLSLWMRLHLAWPGVAPLKPEQYLALVTMHGTLMIFFVMTAAPYAGFSSLVLPDQIGAEQMAFPRLNALAFWLTTASLIVLLAAFAVPGGAPIGGWSMYPPLSAVAAAGPGQGLGLDLWITSIGLFSIAMAIVSVNLLTTILWLRAPGMRWMRLPHTVWAWFAAAALGIAIFSVLLLAVVLLWCDRHAGTSFFLPAGDLISGKIVSTGDGTPLLWLHLFWFFGHPEVYLAVLPAMGLTTSLLANFSRRPAFGYRMSVITTMAISVLGLMVWGHHMFVSGMNPFAGTAFSMITIAIAIPSTAKVLGWLLTLPGGRIHFKTPMLFSLGFLSLFITGGLTGPILAQPILDSYLHNTLFVVAHFHLIMGMAGAFSLFAGVYYWFPLIAGRRLSERLGRWHFWVTLLGAYAVFLPMHFAGLAGEPRHYSDLAAPYRAGSAMLTALMPLHQWMTIAALALAVGQLLFIANILLTLRQPLDEEENPWQATTLEWYRWPAGEDRRVYRGPDDYGISLTPDGRDFRMQWETTDSPKTESNN